MLAPKSKTMRSLKRKSPARKSMCVPHSALLSGKHPRPLLEQHSASHTRFVRHPVQSIGTGVAFVSLCADSNVFSAYLPLQPYKMFAASDSLRSADRWSLLGQDKDKLACLPPTTCALHLATKNIINFVFNFVLPCLVSLTTFVVSLKFIQLCEFWTKHGASKMLKKVFFSVWQYLTRS